MFNRLFGRFGGDIGMAHFAVLDGVIQGFYRRIHMSFGFALGSLGAFFGMFQRGCRVFDQYRSMAGLAVSDGGIGMFQCCVGVWFRKNRTAQQQ